MPSVTFLFSAGLWALPLASLPVVLHLLLRQKSPAIAFSTLRFIQVSVQHAAARRKVRRWLLLACRAALLAALIWAISQPAMKAAAAGGGTAAVLVIDTSYSMQLQDGASTLLARADQTARDLLAGRLRGAQVAILRSAPVPADRPELEELRRQEHFHRADEIRWSPLRPQAAPQPLADRAAAAALLLENEPASDKQIIVISDLQRREFPRTIEPPRGIRLSLIDLHPDESRNVAVRGIDVVPRQPVPGLESEAVVEITGRPGDLRQVNLSMSGPRGEAAVPLAPQSVQLDDSGRDQVRFPIRLPASGFQRLEASLATAQPLAWGQSRALVLAVPPRQVVALLPAPQFDSVTQRLGWALDPNDGHDTAWPLVVRPANDVPADADVIVALLSDWPDAERATRLLEFVQRGRTLIWFVRPGLEQTWESLPAAQKAALEQLLPGRPTAGARVADASTAAIVAPADPVLSGLTEQRYQIGAMTVRRLMPFDAIDPRAQTLLSAIPSGPAPRSSQYGLVFRRSVGEGTVFTFATLPDKRFSTLHLHPVFPPMLVQMALRPAGRSDAQNVEIGAPLVLSGPKFDRFAELRVQGPQGAVDRVTPSVQDGARRFLYSRADEPGTYVWRGPEGEEIVAVSNVQFPAAEADLHYARAEEIAPPGTGTPASRSANELEGKLSEIDQPRPLWAAPLGIVLVFLCVEAMLGSASSRLPFRNAPSMREW